MLAPFAQALAAGAVRVVDLTHAPSAGFASLQLPPQCSEARALRCTRFSHHDDAGRAA